MISLIERDDAILLERRRDAPLWSLIAGMVHARAELRQLPIPATQRPIVDRLLSGGLPPHLD